MSGCPECNMAAGHGHYGWCWRNTACDDPTTTRAASNAAMQARTNARMSDDDREFYDRAFCALLAGQLETRPDLRQHIVDSAEAMALLALATRNARVKGETDGK